MPINKKTDPKKGGKSPKPAATPKPQEEISPQARKAKSLIAECLDLVQRNERKVEAFMGKAQASPEGAAGTLEEVAALFLGAGAYFGARAILLRHGPGVPNPMLATAGRSVRNSLAFASTQIENEVHTPHSWKVAKDRVADASKVITHVLGLLECDGVSLTVRTEEPLRDVESGDPLIPDDVDEVAFGQGLAANA